MLDRLEAFGVELVDSFFADACHEAVFGLDLEVFVVGFGGPRIIFDTQTLDPGALLLRLQLESLLVVLCISL